MNWKGWLLLGIIILISAGVTALVWFRPAAVPPPAPEEPEVGNLEGQSIYASGEYGFTLRYPSADTISEDFSTFYHLAPEWRANGTAEATGTPVLQITSYATESDHSFPRYFTAMVRIGVSGDKKEVATCEKLVPDAGEEALPDAVINGTTWKVFSFQNAGMMQYVKGVSYRVVHDGTCVVMEKLATGSSYRDDPDSADDIPQAKLDEEYTQLDDIVSTFAFTTP